MIRDPSDGSVREAPKASDVVYNSPVVKESLTPDTGLRQPTRPDAQERLEKSRQWLKSYQDSRK